METSLLKRIQESAIWVSEMQLEMDNLQDEISSLRQGESRFPEDDGLDEFPDYHYCSD